MSNGARPLPDTGALTTDDAKERLREVLRDRRSSLHRHPTHGHGPGCEALTSHALQAVNGARCVAAFVSVGSEPCTRLLLERLGEQGVEVLLPVLGPRLARCWGRFSGSHDLAERSPGRPPEPGGQALPAQAVAQAEALIVPALAVDRSGQRLGQGGGWYDRMLPLRRDGTPAFAVVHPDELFTDHLPVEPHDQRVDAIICEEQWFLLEGSQFSSSGPPPA
ncbi:5-formyltetrahydrofolate cyclo-ligase [Actinomyces wuliandei]|uniref:5-formyltetrahydrofolate cyclo-ligase n=1 Tax=Actinomyces wuliandei TaxID=2057743 RepID=UPI000FD801FF|nr:5-formyltetrahydrofolate cyclo-ligase [Actinomyces wuliandei]